MNLTVENNSTETLRNGRNMMMQSPLISLLLAATLLNKLSSGKSYLKSPWQYRPYYSQLPPPFLWYPYDSQTAYYSRPDLPIKHVVHVHNPFLVNSENNNDDKKETDLSANANEITQNGITLNASESPLSTPQLSDELKEFLDALLKRNISKLDVENEIPEPDELYGKLTENDDGVQDTTLQTNHILESDGIKDQIESAESNIDLHAAESNNNKRQKQKTQSEYEYNYVHENDDDDEDDLIPVTNNKQRIRPTTAALRRTTPKTHQSTRINSKRQGVYKSGKRTTPMTFDDGEEEEEFVDYDFSSTLPPRRKVTSQSQKRNRHPTTPTYEFNDYDNGPKRRKPQRRYPTTSAPHYDYYETENDSNYYNDDAENDYNKNKNKNTRNKFRPNFRPRADQDEPTTTEMGNTADTTTTSDMSTEMTTVTQTQNSTQTTSTSTDSSSESSNTTSSDYPYYGNNNHENISITYGPPVDHHHGYGPSNGNEHISITYAPPSGSNQDNWYNHYSKNSVFSRIQDLLTPTNYYSQQYDINYNDNGNL